jgi:hypothetical protein
MPSRASLWFAAVFTVFCVCQIPFLAEPFGDDVAGINGGVVEGPIQTYYEREGFLRLAGRPAVFLLPSSPPEVIGYDNHPPLLYWYTRIFTSLFGVHEWTLRLPAALASAAAFAWIAALAFRWFGNGGAFVAAAFLCVSPLSFEYGRMPNYEAPLLALGLVAFELDSRAPGRRRWAVPALVFAATLVDWCGAFLAPALWIHRWVLDGKRPRARACLADFAGAAAAVCCYCGLLWLWRGDFGATLRYFGALWKDTTIPTAGVDRGPWLVAVAGYLTAVLPLPALLLACVGLLRCARPGTAPRAARAAVAGWLFLPCANIAAFPGRAYAHEYWWFYVLPAAAILLAFAASKPAWLAAAAAALIAAAGGVQTWQRHKSVDFTAIEAGNAMMRSVYDEQTVLLYWGGPPNGIRSMYFRPSMMPVDTRVNPESKLSAEAGLATIRRTAARFLAGELRCARLAVMVFLSDFRGGRTVDDAALDEILKIGFREGPRLIGDGVRFYEMGEPARR